MLIGRLVTEAATEGSLDVCLEAFLPSPQASFFSRVLLFFILFVAPRFNELIDNKNITISGGNETFLGKRVSNIVCT